MLIPFKNQVDVAGLEQPRTVYANRACWSRLDLDHLRAEGRGKKFHLSIGHSGFHCLEKFKTKRSRCLLMHIRSYDRRINAAARALVTSAENCTKNVSTETSDILVSTGSAKTCVTIYRNNVTWNKCDERSHREWALTGKESWPSVLGKRDSSLYFYFLKLPRRALDSLDGPSWREFLPYVPTPGSKSMAPNSIS